MFAPELDQDPYEPKALKIFFLLQKYKEIIINDRIRLLFWNETKLTVKWKVMFIFMYFHH